MNHSRSSYALKYRQPDRRPDIHISTTDLENDWLFSVRDNGRGFNMTDSERVFQMLCGSTIGRIQRAWVSA